MPNFTVAIVTTVYALVCLARESDLGIYTWSTSIGKCPQKEVMGKRQANVPGMPKISGTKSNHE